MTNINFVQMVEMTDDEKFEMYNKCTKKELIRMLIQANKVLDDLYNPTYKLKCVNPGSFQQSDNFTTTTYGDMEINYVEPHKDCDHLCYDCEKGSYCWDSECNEVSNL